MPGALNRRALGRHRHRHPRLDHVTLNLGILLALTCAVATQLGFLYKHRGANAAPKVHVRYPLRTVKAHFASK